MKSFKNSHLKYLSIVTNVLAVIILFLCGVGVFVEFNTKFITTILISIFMFFLGIQVFYSYIYSNKNYFLIVSILCMIISLFNLYLIVENVGL